MHTAFHINTVVFLAVSEFQCGCGTTIFALSYSRLFSIPRSSAMYCLLAKIEGVGPQSFFLQRSGLYDGSMTASATSLLSSLVVSEIAKI